MTSCPGDPTLVRLLDLGGEDDSNSIHAHIEHCIACQEALKRLTSDVFSFSNPGDREGERIERLADASRAADCPGGPDETTATVDERTRLLPDGSEDDPAGRHDRRSFNPASHGVEGYEILSELGHGGMGVVYKARHRRLNRLVALKMIRAGSLATLEERSRFRIEAEAVAKLRHPNIIPIYDTGDSGGLPFVTLELLDGGSLDKRVGDTPQPGRDSAALVATLARAIHDAHQAGVVHRDLKPSNILFDREGVPKVADFGLAKSLEEGGPTETGQVLGSPGYIPPEQAQGDSKRVGRSADIYALGAILYKMLTGRPPFRGASPLETIIQVLNQDPVPPSRLRSQVPRELETICLKCLAKKPSGRYPTAEALAEDLDRYLAGRPILAQPTPIWEHGLKWARRRPSLSSTIALGLLLAITLSGLGLRRHGIAVERERARADRVAGNRLSGERTLIQVQGRLLSGRNTGEDNASLHDLRARAAREPRLSDLRDRAAGLLEQAHRLQLDREAIESGRRRYREFLTRRDDALFQAAEITGPHPTGDPKPVRQSALAALEIFDADPPSGDGWKLAVLPASLTEQERDEVVKGCYQMLMILAEATAQPRPGEVAKVQAEGAIRILDRSSGLPPRPTHAYHLTRASCLQRAGDVEGANREREATGRIEPDGAFDHFLIGLQDYKRGLIPQAGRHFQAALRDQPSHFWSQYLLAVCNLNDRPAHPEEAKAYLTGCLQSHPDLPWLYLLRGIASAQSAAGSTPLEASKGFEAAEADFRDALRRDPEGRFFYPLLANRGLTRLQAHRWDDAEADLREAIEVNPRHPSAHVTLAQVYRRQGKPGPAREQLDLAIALKPDSAPLLRMRALWNLESPQLSRTDHSAILLDLEQAIRCDTQGSLDRARDHAKRGALLLLDKRAGEALDASESALEVDPDNADARRVRLTALLELRRYGPMIEACDDYLRSSRASPELLELRGLAKVERDDLAGAIEDYTLAISMDRGASHRYCRRGWAYLAYGAAPMARRDFDEAIRLDPSSGDGSSGRVSTLVAIGQFREAAAEAERAVRCGGTRPRTLYNAARSMALAAQAASTDAAGKGRRDVESIRLYQDRALQVLDQALGSTAPDGRAEFLREVVEADPALKIVRRLPSYSRLAEKWRRPPVASTVPNPGVDNPSDP